eukprot:Unigene1612_Nuclearia_a/m.4999 Unigene1612_Nuclearia_a/g.4999  ORF Unigene1612_Nuclearia_a/g.4999 Unigene1612_Nuclearia_a/m.4999 type:complete len:115 (+) Unigene1612_Nuclearia_a:161-505(+)
MSTLRTPTTAPSGTGTGAPPVALRAQFNAVVAVVGPPYNAFADNARVLGAVVELNTHTASANGRAIAVFCGDKKVGHVKDAQNRYLQRVLHRPGLTIAPVCAASRPSSRLLHSS